MNILLFMRTADNTFSVRFERREAEAAAGASRRTAVGQCPDDLRILEKGTRHGNRACACVKQFFDPCHGTDTADRDQGKFGFGMQLPDIFKEIRLFRNAAPCGIPSGNFGGIHAQTVAQVQDSCNVVVIFRSIFATTLQLIFMNTGKSSPQTVLISSKHSRMIRKRFSAHPP